MMVIACKEQIQFFVDCLNSDNRENMKYTIAEFEDNLQIMRIDKKRDTVSISTSFKIIKE